MTPTRDRSFTSPSPSREGAFHAIRRADEGRGWGREDRVVRWLGGGSTAVALLDELVNTGEVLRDAQIWTMLNDNFDPTGLPDRVSMLRLNLDPPIDVLVRRGRGVMETGRRSM